MDVNATEMNDTSSCHATLDAEYHGPLRSSDALSFHRQGSWERCPQLGTCVELDAVRSAASDCNATWQDKGRRRGNLKQAVKSFIEWLNSRAAVSSAERIKIGDYRNRTDHDVSLVMSWKLREKERKVQVSLQSPIL